LIIAKNLRGAVEGRDTYDEGLDRVLGSRYQAYGRPIANLPPVRRRRGRWIQEPLPELPSPRHVDRTDDHFLHLDDAERSTAARDGVLREVLAESKASLDQTLAGGSAPAANGGSKFTVIGQAGLGFILPWILSMVAIPLEMLIETSQHVFYKLLILFVNLFGYLCNMIGYSIEYLFKIIIHLYDVYIIVPAQIGNAIGGGGKSKARTT
jgi:hypothetical protein